MPVRHDLMLYSIACIEAGRAQDQLHRIYDGIATDIGKEGKPLATHTYVQWSLSVMNQDGCKRSQNCMRAQNISVDELKTAIVTSAGPQSQATQAEYVKFHDDKVATLQTHAAVY